MFTEKLARVTSTTEVMTPLVGARLGQGRTTIDEEGHDTDIITYYNGLMGVEATLTKMVKSMGIATGIVDAENLTQRSLALTSPEPLRRRRRACIPVALRKRWKLDTCQDIACVEEKPNTGITGIVLTPGQQMSPEPGPQERAAVDLVNRMKSGFARSLAVKAYRIATFKADVDAMEENMNWALSLDRGNATRRKSTLRQGTNGDGGNNVNHSKLKVTRLRYKVKYKKAHRPSRARTPPPQRPERS